MIRLRFVILLMGFLAIQGCYAQQTAPPQSDSFKAVTWNIQWFPGRFPDAPQAVQKKHIADAQAMLRDLQPDVLLLQEIRDYSSAKKLISVVPGLKLHVISDYPKHSQNMVVASKYPLDSAWMEAWEPTLPDGPPRGFAFAAIKLSENHVLLVYSVHFKSNHGEESTNFALRQEAARQLLRHIEKIRNAYSHYQYLSVLVGGDFNTSLDDPRFEREKTLRTIRQTGMKWVFQKVPFRERITIPASGPYPNNTFDHLFYQGINVQSVNVPQFPEVSDHNPIVAYFSVSDRTANHLNLSEIETLRVVNPAPAPLKIKEGEVIPTENRDMLLRLVGQEVTVKGTIMRVGQSPSGHLLFINFSNRRDGFTATVHRGKQDAFEQWIGGHPRERLEGKTVELRGQIELFRGNPQMKIKEHKQLIRGF